MIERRSVQEGLQAGGHPRGGEAARDHVAPSRPAWPAYLSLLESGELERRVRAGLGHLERCDLCARYCRVDRRRTTRGTVCRTGVRAVVHGHGPHHGEELPLRGRAGSGTIFFSRCSLRCVYCQNWEISWMGAGREVGADELAAMMLDLQRRGCHNANLVSPGHVVPQILEATLIAAREGLRLPLVYNTGGYDSPEALALLDGVIDIYMPDMKYADPEAARAYSGASDYWDVNRAAVQEMHRQVGDLALDDRGLARRGLLVRHLVLPGDVARSEGVLAFLAERISRNTYLNLMDQYLPWFRASRYPPLDRRPGPAEFDRVVELAHRHGLHRIDHELAPPV